MALQVFTVYVAMADEDASLLQTARALPISERVAHKNWKVRAEAFDDLKTTSERVFSSDDPQLSSVGIATHLELVGLLQTARKLFSYFY